MSTLIAIIVSITYPILFYFSLLCSVIVQVKYFHICHMTPLSVRSAHCFFACHIRSQYPKSAKPKKRNKNATVASYTAQLRFWYLPV